MFFPKKYTTPAKKLFCLSFVSMKYKEFANAFDFVVREDWRGNFKILFSATKLKRTDEMRPARAGQIFLY